MTRLLSAIARRRSELLVGREPLDIDRLISPLRYDVLVREQYLGFLRVNRDVYDGDFEAYVELARSEPYYAWFRAVAIHRIRPGKDNRGAELEAAFRERLRKTAWQLRPGIEPGLSGKDASGGAGTGEGPL